VPRARAARSPAQTYSAVASCMSRMALVTTMATTPVLQLLSGVPRPPDRDDGETKAARGEVPIPVSRAV